jgi:C1A family cysteine protease
MESNSTMVITNTTTDGTIETDAFSNLATPVRKRSLLDAYILPKRQAAQRPAVVDWRDRDGINYLATVQSQQSCGSCTLFAVTALAETMVRIQHGFWSKRSESDLRDSWGNSCDRGVWDFDATEWARVHGGIADAECVPYAPQDTNYMPCADWSGRTLRLPAATALKTIEEQKEVSSIYTSNLFLINNCF